jgi:hypothetical protein
MHAIYLRNIVLKGRQFSLHVTCEFLLYETEGESELMQWTFYINTTNFEADRALHSSSNHWKNMTRDLRYSRMWSFKSRSSGLWCRVVLRLRQQGLPKRRYPNATIYGVTTQKISTWLNEHGDQWHFGVLINYLTDILEQSRPNLKSREQCCPR